MRVLMVEEDAGLGDEVADHLRRAGHQVSSCRTDAAAAFPCRGMDAVGECPLESPTAVAVVMGSDRAPTAAPTPGLDGARCALRREIPLVVSGGGAAAAFRDRAARDCGQTDPSSVVAAVEQAADAPLARHGVAAADAVVNVLDIHGFDSTAATAAVTRSGDTLRVALRPGVDVDRHLREVLSVRALAAVREVDPFTPRIGVSVSD